MKIQVEFNAECPFFYTEEVVYSSWTTSSDDCCKILDGDCVGLGQQNCPLKDDSVLVQTKEGD